MTLILLAFLPYLGKGSDPLSTVNLRAYFLSLLDNKHGLLNAKKICFIHRYSHKTLLRGYCNADSSLSLAQTVIDDAV